MMSLRAIRVIAGSVLLEAVRRKDIYVIVILCCLLITSIISIDFFGIQGLAKFYREIALSLMSYATATAVILLAVRQLHREFDNKTIYTLLARPVSRLTFLIGKATGVLLAGAFCLGLFSIIFIGGIYFSGTSLHWSLFAQHLYLQMLQALVLTAACFLLSLVMSYDASIVVGLLLYMTAGVLSRSSLLLYSLTNSVGRWLIRAQTYALPQFVILDLSGKTVHSEIWDSLSLQTMGMLTTYALIYTLAYGGLAFFLFQRRPL